MYLVGRRVEMGATVRRMVPSHTNDGLAPAMNFSLLFRSRFLDTIYKCHREFHVSVNACVPWLVYTDDHVTLTHVSSSEGY